MPNTLKDPVVDQVLALRQAPSPPFPSPADWRDHWIYFLLVDRFNNPAAPPRCSDPCNRYQGGNFAGIQERLPYLKDLGAGAVWLSPVLMNPPWFKDYWGGYGISDFLRIEPRSAGIRTWRPPIRASPTANSAIWSTAPTPTASM